jgi:hypothetical protein
MFEEVEGQHWWIDPVFPGSLNNKANLRPTQTVCAAFVEYLVDCLARLKDEHNITVDYVSPVNEPQYGWDNNYCEGARMY